MPAPKDIDFYENPFGYELRRHRERLGLTQVQLSERLGYSDDTISKVETGQTPPSEVFARDCDTMFDTHGSMESFARLVRKGGAFPVWMWHWVEFERRAHTLRNWELVVVPGLVQTADYAREVIRTYPGRTDEQVEKEVAARLERQQILDSDDPPMLWVVVHENVLHSEVGNSKIMHDQLQFLLDAAQRTRISIRVVPRSAGMHAGNAGAFAIGSIDGSPDVVYLESARAGRVTDRQDDVQEVMNIWEAIREEALPTRASLDLIAQVMEQWI